MTYKVNRPLADLSFGFHLLRSTDNLLVYDANFLDSELAIAGLEQNGQFVVEFKFRTNLTRGQYHLACHVFHNPTNSFVSRLSPIGMMTVRETRTFSGIADVALQARVVARDVADEHAPSTGPCVLVG